MNKYPISPLSLDEEAPATPEFRKVAEDVLNSLKYSFAVTATRPQLTAPGRADALFQQFHQQCPPKKRAAYQAKAQALLQAPVQTRQVLFGRYGTVEPDQYAKVGSDQVVKQLAPLAVKAPALTAGLQKIIADRAAIVRSASAKQVDHREPKKDNHQDAHKAVVHHKVGLFMKKLHCVVTTDDSGDCDEIRIGGTVIGPDGKARKVGPFPKITIDDGETFDYRPDKLFAEFDLHPNDDAWPKTFRAVMAMAEEDWGGFGDFLSDMWNMVDEKVTAAVGAAAGYAAGSFIPIPGLGSVIGAAIGWVIGKLGAFISECAEDEIFKSKTVSLRLARPSADVPPPFHLDYVGFHGHYRLWCYWKVYG